MTKYVVTGAQGLVGRYLSQALLDSAADAVVIGIGRSSRDDTSFKHPLLSGGTNRAPLPVAISASLRERFVYHQLDVLDSTRLAHLLQAERAQVVYHLASSLRYGDSADMMRTNVSGTVALLNAVSTLSGQKPRIVLGSSGAVYGMLTAGQLPVDEGNRCAPVDIYAASKLAAEHVTHIIGRRHGICTVVARMFNVVGPGQDDRHVCGRFTSQLCAGVERINVRNLQTSRDFIDVRDVAAALACLGENGACGNVYNVASGNEVYISELLSRLIDRTGFLGEVVSDPSPWDATDVPRHVADISRLRALGFEHKHTLGESLHDLVAYQCAATIGARGVPHEHLGIRQ